MHLRALRPTCLALAAVGLLVAPTAAAADLQDLERKKGPKAPTQTAAPYATDLTHKQWDMAEIGSPLANSVATGAGVTVAVIDTGIDVDHNEFAGRIVNPVSWVCPKGVKAPCQGMSYVDDGHGHGTHVAGTVAAAADGSGITGVAPQANIMPLRVGDDDGSISGDTTAAMRYAVAEGADVITMSIGYVAGTGPILDNPVLPVDEFSAAVQEASDAGILVTLSAGNDGVPWCGQGSEFYNDTALCVAAYGPTEDPAVYTDWGYEIDIAAPGGGILTCDGAIWATVPLSLETDSCTGIDGYGVMSGTSMAAPHVAGVGALLAQQGITGATAAQRIVDTARTDLPLTTAFTGPRLDAAAAVGAG
ncbi:hypothetical protein DDE18_20550 [Nocardioides gansuensis]|uniref:Peptidase S8/S53 domain-containing protein n=1 Tax=Nocardioides gansuensis TaxID=2138300 RepID=A0A2T8F5G0_9ACTN|nr:S8 family serine peptidase [Nocardioides gansuensis]PVG80954.1 hypothetical protein DDE18_20550 [Nocardioides gansuensis]